MAIPTMNTLWHRPRVYEMHSADCGPPGIAVQTRPTSAVRPGGSANDRAAGTGMSPSGACTAADGRPARSTSGRRWTPVPMTPSRPAIALPGRQPSCQSSSARNGGLQVPASVACSGWKGWRLCYGSSATARLKRKRKNPDAILHSGRSLPDDSLCDKPARTRSGRGRA
jgi:hypothetical protein